MCLLAPRIIALYCYVPDLNFSVHVKNNGTTFFKLSQLVLSTRYSTQALLIIINQELVVRGAFSLSHMTPKTQLETYRLLIAKLSESRYQVIDGKMIILMSLFESCDVCLQYLFMYSVKVSPLMYVNVSLEGSINMH